MIALSCSPLWLCALGLLALAALSGAGWGPGTHLEFAERVLRRRRERLPAEVAQLLGEQRAAYCYGNIAADIINFKGYGGHYNHCHRWTIVHDMRERAQSPVEEAFVLGYLAHLAADTIAHNHFVPYHLARYARGLELGHLYWEANADRFVPEARWRLVSELKANHGLAQLDELVNASVPRKLLPKGANKLIFNHLLLGSEGAAWRRNVARIHPLSQLALKPGFLELFRRAAVARIELALQPHGIEQLAHIDTNGKEAQRAALRTRQVGLERFKVSRETRALLAEERAAPFLEGMATPPPRGGEPLWARAKPG